MQKPPSLLLILIPILSSTWADAAPPGTEFSSRLAPHAASSGPVVSSERGGLSARPGRELAQADEPEPVVKRPSATEVLQDSRSRLMQYASVKANIHERVSILDHSFIAKGSYLQGKNLQLRLEFSLELGGNKASLLEVCDGQVLWTRHEISSDAEITRRDVREILKAAERNGRVPQNTLIAELGLGGLPGLLAALEVDLDFRRVSEDTIDSRPVIMIEGKWKPAFLQRLTGTKLEGKEKPMPPFIPDLARIYFDKETRFPRRIMYLKSLPDRKVLRPMLVLDFTKVVLNGPTSEQDFLFIPPDSPAPKELTHFYLERLLQAAPAGEGGPRSPLPETKTTPRSTEK